MKERIFEIFKECYPQILITQDIFYRLFDYEQCEVLSITEHDEVIGFSAVRENYIVLLCVTPKYQRMGYGSWLVAESEKLIKNHGYNMAILGGANSKLFLGATTQEDEWKEKHNYFFENCGYTATNGCLEMVMSLKDYNLNQVSIPLCSEQIVFDYWDQADKTGLLSAVKEVEEDWLMYFETANTIFTATEQGHCIGFTILNFDDLTLCNNGFNKVGTIGCVGVIPSERNRGIGLAMVAHATEELKNHRCDESYIHYTYLDWWYGRLGYHSILWYWFGSKSLS